MADVVLTNDEITVLSPPEIIEVLKLHIGTALECLTNVGVCPPHFAVSRPHGRRCQWQRE